MADSKKIGSFGMERMKQKDEEARLERMNTRQRKGTPTVSNLFFEFERFCNINLFSEMLGYKQKCFSG